MVGDTSGPRRRPDSGGYARGEETRLRIIKAALDVFGVEGYERASTRAIARDAGVNPPALQYYFDSKEGLHLACAEYIIAQAGEILPLTLKRAQEVVATGQPAHALDMLCELLETVMDISIAAKQVPSWSRFMARVQADITAPAARYLRERISWPIQSIISAMVAVIIGRPADDEETRLRASLVLSQISAFSVHRVNTLALLEWPDFAGRRGEAVKAQLRAHTRAALGYGP